MNIYELLGRVGVLHLDCEDLFSKLGSIIDNKRVDLISDSDSDFDSAELSMLESNLLYLIEDLTEYKELISNYSTVEIHSCNIVSYILDKLLGMLEINIKIITGLYNQVFIRYDINFSNDNFIMSIIVDPFVENSIYIENFESIKGKSETADELFNDIYRIYNYSSSNTTPYVAVKGHKYIDANQTDYNKLFEDFARKYLCV